VCYSAQVTHEYKQFVREYGAGLSLREFVNLFWRRRQDRRIRVPKSMEAAFGHPASDEEREIARLLEEIKAEEIAEFEQELFKQRKRLADAERSLKSKETKTAQESRRVAGNKVEWILGQLSDLKRTELKDRDSRIYPGWYAPVIVSEGGRRVVKPMRYQCRPAGKPAWYDTKYPGTYNARRDSLRGFWKGLYGYTHGILVVSAFYENVERQAPDGMPKNVVLEFRPRPAHQMLVACLWSRWTAPGEPDLLSFVAITDEPPPEIAAAGHDRCIVPIKPENVDPWLNPDPRNLDALDAILDDRDRPYYEHRMAA
jgi:putative SOS response-associated peptidase YedK